MTQSNNYQVEIDIHELNPRLADLLEKAINIRSMKGWQLINVLPFQELMGNAVIGKPNVRFMAFFFFQKQIQQSQIHEGN